MNDKARLLSRRQSYVARWEHLKADTYTSLDSAERFGALVQHVVETVYLDAVWQQAEEYGLRHAVLDDLVDLFVPPRFQRLKRFVMVSPAVLDEAIIDKKEDRQDFASTLRPGGGRFRHFAMNAAAAEYYPLLLVNLTARIVGYDVPWRYDPIGDSQGDLATNRIGRDFSHFLKSNAIGELAANAAVQGWVTTRFKSG